MSDPVSDFVADVARESKALGKSPIEVLQAAGVHKSMWARWNKHGVSPTLRTAHAVRQKLDEMAASQDRAA